MDFIGITALVALALSAFGFVMYVYFFSIGYGFSIAGIGAALLILFRNQLTLGTIILCGLLILYGIRLGGYLAIRELKSLGYKNLLKEESKKTVPVGVKSCHSNNTGTRTTRSFNMNMYSCLCS